MATTSSRSDTSKLLTPQARIFPAFEIVESGDRVFERVPPAPWSRYSRALDAEARQ